jgi:hypothetical protein
LIGLTIGILLAAAALTLWLAGTGSPARPGETTPEPKAVARVATPAPITRFPDPAPREPAPERPKLVAPPDNTPPGKEIEKTPPGPEPTTPQPAEDPPARPEAREPDSGDIYYYKPPFLAGKPSRNVKVYQTDAGQPGMSVLGEDGAIGWGQDGGVMHLGVLIRGSTGVRVEVNRRLGFTPAAGLRFKDNATLSVAEDGLVEVDHAGVKAVDAGGTPYVSRKVSVSGREVVALVKTRGGDDKPSGDATPPEPRGFDVYRWTPPLKVSGVSQDIEVYEKGRGSVTYTGMVDGAKLFLARKPDGGQLPMPDALGSTNIKVKINRQLGYTTLAGLRFKDDATVNVLPNGTVQVDRAGIRATGAARGGEYVSREVLVDGVPTVVMGRPRNTPAADPAVNRAKEEDPARAREASAASKLRVARYLLRDGEVKQARAYLTEVVDRYADTPAADEARALLEKHPIK